MLYRNGGKGSGCDFRAIPVTVKLTKRHNPTATTVVGRGLGGRSQAGRPGRWLDSKDSPEVEMTIRVQALRQAREHCAASKNPSGSQGDFFTDGRRWLLPNSAALIHSLY